MGPKNIMAAVKREIPNAFTENEPQTRWFVASHEANDADITYSRGKTRRILFHHFYVAVKSGSGNKGL
jgi:hypothetical protein